MSTNNIITASFPSGLRATTTKKQYQYNYGQRLTFEGLDLPDTFEVHFSNSLSTGKTKSRIATGGTVVIPDEYYESGANIYAFIFLHSDTDDGETMYTVVIPIERRPKPSNLEPTPVQQDAITEAIAALNSVVEQSAASVVAAANSAIEAAGSAQDASESAAAASRSQTAAAGSASAAGTSAAAAAASETNAASSARAAETSETNAKKSEEAAAESKEAAAASVQEAKNIAQMVYMDENGYFFVHIED